MKISKSKSITLTPTMRAKGLVAFATGGKAEVAKNIFFNAIKSRVPEDAIREVKNEFKSIAMRYYAELHTEDILTELANPTLKNSQKLKGCKLTMKAIKDGIDTMARRWMADYKRYLNTGVIVPHGGKAGVKRTPKVTVNPKADKAASVEAPATTPVKRAIEFLTTIHRTVLQETKPSQCPEELRNEIQIASLLLVKLLTQIK